jgi:uncharacterized protein YegP (UPF0339 family)
MPASFAIPEIDRLRTPTNLAGPTRFRQADSHASFEVFRTDRVSLTSILYSGGDWRWRFRSGSGTILVNSEGYNSESACRAAVKALQDNGCAAKIAE